jgi:carbon starvation protein CstA
VLLFLGSVAALIVGYLTYAKVVEKAFGIEPGRPTPAVKMADGVDYVVLPPWKIFLIQLLNIAGLGPIFGPILGALYGPAALLWIVIGTLFAGAVHDYFSGMLSVRNRGMSIPEVVGRELGGGMKQFMRAFSIVVLLLVGVVFVLGPAKLLTTLSGMPTPYWVAIIFGYYFLATVLPIDKLIGRLYPIFGAVLLFMAFGLTVALFAKGYDVFPRVTLENLHPKSLPMWPLMFITIACGAISGFHSTQSPLMARCMANERHGRGIFYGAMVGEGVIALIWAMLGMSFYESPEALNAVLANGGPATVVNQVSVGLLGTFGGALAIIGVVVLPITSGDTAFRAARLIVADFLKYPQRLTLPRLYIAVPLFAVGFLISKSNFDVLWRYFGWANQTLAMLVLWTGAVYMAKRGKAHWIATVPAAFMTVVSVAYIANAKIGFNLPIPVSTGAGVLASAAALVAFFTLLRRSRVEAMREAVAELDRAA